MFGATHEPVSVEHEKGLHSKRPVPHTFGILQSNCDSIVAVSKAITKFVCYERLKLSTGKSVIHKAVTVILREPHSLLSGGASPKSEASMRVKVPRLDGPHDHAAFLPCSMRAPLPVKWRG